MSLALDHIGLICGDLDAGAQAFHRDTGVELGPGGTHPRMGTHNRLLNTGGGTYLELIAVNPAAPKPDQPRWFGLDAVGPDQGPRLSFWMVRVDDLDAAIRIAGAEGYDAGQPVAMSRGDLSWRLSIRADGALPFDGAAPIMIEWPEGTHPTQNMAAGGLTLRKLHVRHPHADRISACCRALGGVPDHVEFATGDVTLVADMAADTGGRVRIG